MPVGCPGSAVAGEPDGGFSSLASLEGRHPLLPRDCWDRRPVGRLLLLVVAGVDNSSPLVTSVSSGTESPLLVPSGYFLRGVVGTPSFPRGSLDPSAG